MNSPFAGFSYFRAASFAMAMSAIMLLASEYFLRHGLKDTARVELWVGLAQLVLAMLPMVWYHLVVLLPRARRGALGQAAVDSVYYFGFLITVGALSLTAVSLADATTQKIGPVLMKFGLGLLATGYAVFARMHLGSLSQLDDESTPEHVRSLADGFALQMLEKVGLIVSSFDQLAQRCQQATARMDALSDEIVGRTESAAQRVQAQALQSMQEAAAVFQRSLTESMATTMSGVDQLKAAMADARFVVDRRELATTLKETVESVQLTAAALVHLREDAIRGAEGAAALTAAQSKLAEASTGASALLGRFTDSDGPLVQSIHGLTAGMEALKEGSREVTTAIHQLGSMAKAANQGTASHRKLVKTLDDVDEHLGKLHEVTQALGQSLAAIDAPAVRAGQLVQDMATLADAVPRLAASSASLSEAMTALSGASAAATQGLQQVSGAVQDQRQATELASSSTQAASAGMKHLGDTVTEARTAVTQINQAFAAMQQLQPALAGLSAAMAAMRGVVEQFPAAVQRTEQELAASAAAVRSAVKGSADQLAADVDRTAKAATLFSSKLVEVAQVVIDRTNDFSQRPGGR